MANIGLWLAIRTVNHRRRSCAVKNFNGRSEGANAFVGEPFQIGLIISERQELIDGVNRLNYLRENCSNNVACSF